MNKKELFKSLFLPGKHGRDYSLRNLCIAVIFLLAIYATSTFPGWYLDGLTLTEAVGIAMTMLAAIVVFYMERRFSSRMGAREPDWSTAAGTLRAFSFDNRVCGKCGKRRILASPGKGKLPIFTTPGLAAPPDSSAVFYCARCGDFVPPAEAKRVPYQSGRVGYAMLSSLEPELRSAKRYRLNKGYQKRYLLVTLILLAGLVSSAYFSSRGPLWLLLPLIVGYFFFVCFITTVSNLFACYSVCSAGVILRGFWGATLYSVEDAAALVRFRGAEGSAKVYGFYTGRENLSISPIIDDSEKLVEELRGLCERMAIPVLQ